jgi:hypothetical protein
MPVGKLKFHLQFGMDGLKYLSYVTARRTDTQLFKKENKPNENNRSHHAEIEVFTYAVR